MSLRCDRYTCVFSFFRQLFFFSQPVSDGAVIERRRILCFSAEHELDMLIGQLNTLLWRFKWAVSGVKGCLHRRFLPTLLLWQCLGGFSLTYRYFVTGFMRENNEWRWGGSCREQSIWTSRACAASVSFSDPTWMRLHMERNGAAPKNSSLSEMEQQCVTCSR